MAKYLDETGAEQLNQLLAANFDTQVDKPHTKVYEGLIGTDNTDATCAFFFGSVRPASFYEY